YSFACVFVLIGSSSPVVSSLSLLVALPISLAFLSSLFTAPFFRPGQERTQHGFELGFLARGGPFFGFECGADAEAVDDGDDRIGDRKSTRLNSSHVKISFAVFCLKT